jgi:hypothetical protein
LADWRRLCEGESKEPGWRLSNGGSSALLPHLICARYSTRRLETPEAEELCRSAEYGR